MWKLPQASLTAYVVFQGHLGINPPARWLDLFTSPGFRHCWIMVPVYFPRPSLMAEVYTMKIEPMRWGVDHELWFNDPEDIATQFMEKGATVVLKVRCERPVDKFIPRGIYTCVSQCKAVLGIQDRTVWTPKQLFRYLVARGAQPHQMLHGGMNDDDAFQITAETEGAGP